eukprot:4260003-Amphidinium_carterae.2
MAEKSIVGDFDIKELNQRGFKRKAIGGWIASILAELAVRPEIRLNSWKLVVCSTQADFDETLASAERAFLLQAWFRSNKKGLVPKTDVGCRLLWMVNHMKGKISRRKRLTMPSWTLWASQEKAAPKKPSSLERSNLPGL